MTNPLHNLQNEAQKIRLTSREKQMIRARIFEMADTSQRTASARVRVHSSYSWFSLRFAVPTAALLIVAMGGGTAYAAQGALPGDLLYSVKTNVNESVAGALAFSNEAKVSFHTSVAQTRLQEAETLASQNKLDNNVTDQIEANFEGHVARADELAHTIAETDEGAAVEATVRLDSFLSAHGSILARIGSGSSDEQTKENSNAIALRVRSHGDRGGERSTVVTTAAESYVQTTSITATDSSADAPVNARSKIVATNEQSLITQKKIALQLQKRAQSELSDTQDAFDFVQRALDATTTAKIQTQLAALQKRMEDGKTQLKQNDYETARATFTLVLKDSIELSAFTDASKTFNRDFVRSFRGSDEYDDESGTSNDTATQSSNDKNNGSQNSKGSEDGTSDDSGVRVEVHL